MVSMMGQFLGHLCGEWHGKIVDMNLDVMAAVERKTNDRNVFSFYMMRKQSDFLSGPNNDI
jgi:hypothetical protein